MNRTLFSTVLAASALVLPAFTAVAADDPIKLSERFDDQNVYKVEVKVSMAGKLALTPSPGKQAEVVSMVGSSTVNYDERPMPSEDTKGGRTVRTYRTVEFARTIGDQEQKADVREAVRRMVVIRSDKGKKVPFSPDGPLTWNEIDVVKNDLFVPALVAGLLPTKEVKPGDKWDASAAAVADLTDLETVDGGGLGVEFVSVVTVNNRRHAKLAVSGSVSGENEDGPNRQKLEGTAYFDLEANRLDYLKLTGVHEMLGADGKTTGRLEGTVVMTRDAAKADKLADAALKGMDLTPTADNSQLLYDNANLGVRFVYPRRWHVGVVQGSQLTLDEPKGGGVLLTVTAADKTPTAKAFQDEAKAFLAKQKAVLNPFAEPKRTAEKPALDRFAFDAELPSGKARLEYAVVTTADGGVTAAARLPAAEADELKADIDRILKQLTVTKKIVAAK